MTREAQIRQTAAEWLRYNHPTCTQDMLVEAFRCGAQWADKNPKSPWISVEEWLPEVNQQVYAAIPNLCGTEYATLEYLGDNRWRQDTTEYTYEFSEGVTYWMPIPELPKEEGK